MSNILKNIFFKEDNLEDHVKFWALLGPFFLFLTISLATFDFAILSLIWLFICYRFSFKGLFLSLISLGAYSVFTQFNIEENHLWNLGLEFSIGLSLIISTIGFDEITCLLIDKNDKNLNTEIEKKQKNINELVKNFEQNIAALKKEIDIKNKNINLKEEENENLKKDLQENLLKKDYLFNELDQKINEIEELKIVQDELYEKIAFLKDEEFLQEKNKSLQNDIEAINIMSQKQNEDINKLKNELLQKNDAVVSLESKIEELKSKLVSLDDISNVLKEKENEIQLLKEKNQFVNDSSKDSEILLLTQKNRDLQKEIENIKESFHLEKASREKSLLELNEKNQIVAILESKLSIANLQVSKADEISNVLKQKDAEIQTLKEKIKQQSQNLKINNDSKVKKTNVSQDTLNDFQELSSLYKQLKNQFVEKQNILHQTRQELFFVKEKLTAAEKDQNHDFEDLNESEKIILKDLNITELELEKYIMENAHLENLINTLMAKKERKTSKKTDKEALNKPDVESVNLDQA
ncbi:MAG: hypothetical protein WCT85_02425 [Parachlamydiales bacterium]|jgi:hypothetical protein